MTRRSLMYGYPGVLALLVAVWLTGCSTDTEEPSFTNPLDPLFGEGLPVPDSLMVMVGDQTVRLTWELPDGETAEEYAIFRRRTDGEEKEPERLLTRVSTAEYTDRSVRNGRTYAYRVAAGASGRFGARTEEIEASPGLFTIILSDDDEVTRDRSVPVSFLVPTANAVQLSEDAAQFLSPWHAATGQISWTLSPGDGEKTVYARFRLADGNESLPVHDTIRLDTRATIQSFVFNGLRVRSPGEMIHFRMVTAEPHGQADVTINGVFSSVALFDDGTSGDATAGDGTYERELAIPASAAVEDEAAFGSFVDQAGNAAAEVSAPLLLTVRDKLDPISLLEPVVAEPPDDPAVTLRWTLSSEDGFTAYRIYRAEAAPVDSTDELIGRMPSANALEYDDTDVVEGRTYYYRVYVQDSFGRESGSNTVQAVVVNARPPLAITLREPDAMSASRIALDWDEARDLDFLAYRLYRNTTGAVADNDPLLTEIRDVTAITWDDTGLRENTVYYYRVYVVDGGGLATRSNEVEARTKNEAPPSVTMNAATSIDSTAATLSWGQSQAHDFAFYRLYRDEIPTVTTGSTQVVELDQPAFTSFRDTELESGTRYYYRVFVVDDAEDEQETGSNTITLLTP
jgi:fibronectin type 3 domain-containing protein